MNTTPPNCCTCAHRLNVTLWGLWLATGCRLAHPLRRHCPAFTPKEPPK